MPRITMRAQRYQGRMRKVPVFKYAPGAGKALK